MNIKEVKIGLMLFLVAVSVFCFAHSAEGFTTGSTVTGLTHLTSSDRVTGDQAIVVSWRWLLAGALLVITGICIMLFVSEDV